MPRKIKEGGHPWGYTRDAILKNVDRQGFPRKPWRMLAEELGVKSTYINRRVTELRKRGDLPLTPTLRAKSIDAARDENTAANTPKTMLQLIEETPALTPEQIKKGLSFIALNGDHKDSNAALGRLQQILSGAELGLGPPPPTLLPEQIEDAALMLSVLPPETYPEVVRRAEELSQDPVAARRGTPAAPVAVNGQTHPAG